MKKLALATIALLSLAPACGWRTCKQECPVSCVEECDKPVRKAWVTKTENCHNLCDENGEEYHRKTVVRKS